ncbi:hypothetical protein [Demequina sp.]|uniref:hypothetical protein n=1 Tax=Demequina sp. TaxID=2050685 RepID=UPI0025C367CA|nr:hypothetical protein [Demequina sp.]
MRAAWTALTGAAGFIVGLVPHVLHHVAPVLGTALVAGAGGTVLFGAVGLAATVPMLVRLRRRFRSWWAPAIALTAFAGAFLFSTFVLGPSIGGTADTPTPSTAPVDSVDHEAHH